MIIKCQDGQWYRNARWSNDRAAIVDETEQLTLLVRSKEPMALRSLKRYANALGIKGAGLIGHSMDKTTIGDVYGTVYVALVQLHECPPVPDSGTIVGEPTGIEEPYWPVEDSIEDGVLWVHGDVSRRTMGRRAEALGTRASGPLLQREDVRGRWTGQRVSLEQKISKSEAGT